MVPNEMLTVPGGKIEMRDDRINQRWMVSVESFLMAKYPVTQALYQSVVHQTPATFKGDDHPVETISWYEAAEFCNALSREEGLDVCYRLDDSNTMTFDARADGYRMPTEAEWEYACKAGTNTIRYGAIDHIAWYKSNAAGTTHPVGLKVPNAWGLHDMLGNVWEWCSDVYDESVYGSYRVLRGGGWCDEERGCMATNRRRSHPLKFKIDDLGFRLARNKRRQDISNEDTLILKNQR